MPISDQRREEPGSLMHTIRRHAEELAAYPWATLGIKVPEARQIVAQFDLMTGRIDQLRAEVEQLNNRIEKAHESLAIEEFDGDSCPDLETTIQYAIGRYLNVCKVESDAADRIQELRIQLDQARTADRPYPSTSEAGEATR